MNEAQARGDVAAPTPLRDVVALYRERRGPTS
jgi:hypothetical protein